MDHSAEERPGSVEWIAEHLRPHHHDDEDLTADVEVAGFDLGTDIAHPSLREGAAFDIETDIGRDNEPPEFRR